MDLFNEKKVRRSNVKKLVTESVHDRRLDQVIVESGENVNDQTDQVVPNIEFEEEEYNYNEFFNQLELNDDSDQSIVIGGLRGDQSIDIGSLSGDQSIDIEGLSDDQSIDIDFLNDEQTDNNQDFPLEIDQQVPLPALPTSTRSSKRTRNPSFKLQELNKELEKKKMLKDQVVVRRKLRQSRYEKNVTESHTENASSDTLAGTSTKPIDKELVEKFKSLSFLQYENFVNKEKFKNEPKVVRPRRRRRNKKSKKSKNNHSKLDNDTEPMIMEAGIIGNESTSSIHENNQNENIVQGASWRQVLGNPPKRKFVKEWILFQKKKWAFQHAQKIDPNVTKQRNAKKRPKDSKSKKVSKQPKLTKKKTLPKKNLSDYELIQQKNVADRERKFKELFPDRSTKTSSIVEFDFDNFFEFGVDDTNTFDNASSDTE